MIDPDSELITDLILDEGTGPTQNGRFLPYKDSRKFLTIGYGRNLDTRGISRDEALYMLRADIRDTKERLKIALPWYDQLDPVRRNVLINMAFNLGVRGLLNFSKFLWHLRNIQYDLAAQDILDSKWATQVGKRAQRLAKEIETGKRQRA